MDLTSVDAIILAAGRGSRLGKMGEKLPKGFIEVEGTTLIERSINQLRDAGIRKFIIVTGHRGEHYSERFGSISDIRLVTNPRYWETGSFESLRLGIDGSASSSLVLDSDIIYGSEGLTRIVSSSEASAILASGFTQSGDEVWVTAEDNRLLNLGKERPKGGRSLVGEFVGISKIGPLLKGHLKALYDSSPKEWSRKEYENAFSEVASQIPIHVSLSANLVWGEVDTVEQFSRIRNLLAGRDLKRHE